MTQMQKDFEKEFDRKECLNAGGGWYHDAVKAWIPIAEAKAQREVLENLYEYKNLKHIDVFPIMKECIENLKAWIRRLSRNAESGIRKGCNRGGQVNDESFRQ